MRFPVEPGMTMNIQPRFTKSQARKNRMDEKDRKNDENLVGNDENVKGQIDKNSERH